MFKDETDFENVVGRLKIDTEPNPKHRENLRWKMLAAFKEEQPFNRTIVFRILRRTTMNRKITKLAAAAVIILAVLIGINLLVFDGTSAVYASVVEQLQNARTMTYSLVTRTPVENMPTLRVEMIFMEPGYMRTTTPDGYTNIIDWSQNRGISIWPMNKQYIDFEASNYRHDPARNPFEVVENLRTLPSQADESLGEKIIDGRLLKGFRVTKDDTINTVWIDPQTQQLVRVEMEYTNASGMNTIMTDFQFNVELDESLFSLTPPAGFTPLEVQADVSTVTEQDLIEYLQLWSSWTTDGTFPPTFNPVDLPKVTAEMIKQGEFGEREGSTLEQSEDAAAMYRGIMFVVQLPAQSNWRYAGENVSFGEAETPIFWYKPEGSETWRVIYGDLSIKDVAPEDLPQ